MKKQILILIAGVALSSTVSAAYLETECDTCGANYPAPGPQWEAVAESFASSHGAQVGDTIEVCKQRKDGIGFYDLWTVNTSPVTNDSDLTFLGTGSDDGGC